MGKHKAETPLAKLRWRRVRALLASGLVLGVGAAITLAAWNDSEHSTATFTAGRFGIQGSTNGTAFTDHATPGTAATLSFSVPATSMVPGSTVYALYSVKTTNLSMPGTVRLMANASNNAGLGQYLRYAVRTISVPTCNATTFNNSGPANQVIPATSMMTASAGSTSIQTVQANAGNPVHYCFAVTLPSATVNAAQGMSLTARWEFVGTSTTP